MLNVLSTFDSFSCNVVEVSRTAIKYANAMLRKLYVIPARIITSKPSIVVRGRNGNRFNSLHDREMIVPVKIIAIHCTIYPADRIPHFDKV